MINKLLSLLSLNFAKKKDARATVRWIASLVRPCLAGLRLRVAVSHEQVEAMTLPSISQEFRGLEAVAGQVELVRRAVNHVVRPHPRHVDEHAVHRNAILGVGRRAVFAVLGALELQVGELLRQVEVLVVLGDLRQDLALHRIERKERVDVAEDNLRTRHRRQALVRTRLRSKQLDRKLAKTDLRPCLVFRHEDVFAFDQLRVADAQVAVAGVLDDFGTEDEVGAVVVGEFNHRLLALAVLRLERGSAGDSDGHAREDSFAVLELVDRVAERRFDRHVGAVLGRQAFTLRTNDGNLAGDVLQVACHK